MLKRPARIVAACNALVFDFSLLKNNKGVHSIGSGFTESNPYYALTDSCVAQYHNILPEDGKNNS